jgi:hypothetical protein
MMKIFRNSMLMAAAIVLGFTSCNNDEVPATVETDSKQLIVKIANASASSRAIGTPGTTGNLQAIANGHIFVVDALGTVIENEAMNVTAVLGTGQVLVGSATPTLVPADARVYILANIPSDVTVSSLGSLNAILAAESAIALQTDYTLPAMANSTGTATLITITTPPANSVPGVAAVSVTISPLYSRMELTSVTGTGNIVSYNVTGIFVDNYADYFTLGGGWVTTSLHEQHQSTDFTGVLGNTGSWTATGTPMSSMVANPQTAGNGDVWFYHVAGGNAITPILPRFIVRLNQIVYNDGTSDVTITGERFITVTSYAENIPTFLRGNIYKIGNISFSETDLTTTPNVEDVTLTVNVEVIDWIETALTPQI